MAEKSESPESRRHSLSRRQMLTAGGTGILATAAAAATAVPAHAATAAAGQHSGAAGADGTPEQIHLTWGQNPATSVVVSWAAPGQAIRPRVHVGERVIHA